MSDLESLFDCTPNKNRDFFGWEGDKSGSYFDHSQNSKKRQPLFLFTVSIALHRTRAKKATWSRLQVFSFSKGEPFASQMIFVYLDHNQPQCLQIKNNIPTRGIFSVLVFLMLCNVSEYKQGRVEPIIELKRNLCDHQRTFLLHGAFFWTFLAVAPANTGQQLIRFERQK